MDASEFKMTYRELLEALDEIQPEEDNALLVLKIIARVREVKTNG